MNIMGYMSFKNDKVFLEKSSKFCDSNILRGAVKRLTRIFSQDPLSYDADVKKYRKLSWHLNSTSAVAGLDYLFYVLSWFGFHLINEDSEYYTLQYFLDKNSTLYLFIQRDQDRYIITSHIEVGIHHHKLKNLISTSLLSELHGLLKRELPHIPVYMTYLSESKEEIPDKIDSFQSTSINTSKLSIDVMRYFNNALESAIIAATSISLKRRKLINREAIISLIYGNVLKDLNLSLIHASIIDKLDQFIHHHIVKALDEVKQVYQQKMEEIKLPKDTLCDFSVDTEVYKKIREKFSEDLTLKDSFFDDIERMFTTPLGGSIDEKKVAHKNLRNVSSNVNEKKIDKTYIESIRTYLYNFCKSTLYNILKEQYLPASLAKHQLLKEFKQFLKTVSSNSKKVYEEVMATFMQEIFPSEYQRVVESMYYITEPVKPAEPIEPSFFMQWSDDNPFHSFLLFVCSIISVIAFFLIGMFLISNRDSIPIIDNYPLHFLLTAILIIISSGLAFWIVVNMVKYKLKLRNAR